MNKTITAIAITALLAIAAILFVTAFSSCRTSGYGCHGKLTWKQLERKNNRMY
jgi:outer membrane protein assembly factor BamE (lipoprotein component of BamABCDE complex)